MRWARIALYTLLGIIAVLAISIVVVLNMDLGRVRGYTEEILTSVLNREFAIDGEFHVEVDLRRIRVAATDVRLAGTGWSADPDLASVGHLEGSVATWSLLNWPIRIETLEVEGLRVNLEHDEDGLSNWQFFEPQEEESEEPEPGPPPDLPVIVDQANVTDAVLVYDNPGRPRPFRFSATRLGIDHDEEDYLNVELDGDLNDTPLGLEARAGVVENLVEYYDVTFELSGNLGEIALDGEAAFGNLIRPRRPTMQLTISGPNAEYLTDKLHIQQITTGPLDITASIAPVGEKMQLNVNGDFGEFTLDVSGQFVNLQELQNIDLRVAASGPDAATIGKLIGNPGIPEDPFSIAGSFNRAGTALAIDEVAINVGETRFIVNADFADFPKPNDAVASVRIEGPDFGRFNRLFGLPGRLSGPFRLDVDLEPQPDGSAKVNLAADAEDVQFTIGGTVADTPDLSGTRLRIDFAGPNLRTVTGAAGLADAPAEAFELGVSVERVPLGVRLTDGSMTLGDDRFGFEGLVGNKPLEADTDLSFDMRGSDLAATLGAFGLDADELPSAAFTARGRVQREAEHFVLHDIIAAIGDDLEYELSVEGTVTDRPDLEGSRVRVRTHGASLGALTDAAGIADMPDVPFQAAATVERVEKGFSIDNGRAQVGDDRVEVHGLVGERPLERDTDLRFNAIAPDLKATLAAFGVQVNALPAGEFIASGEIRSRGSTFQLRNISASLAGAQASISGRLGGLPALDGTNVMLRVESDDLARLLPDKDAFSSLDKPFSVAAKVRMDDDLLSVSDAEVRLAELEATVEFEVGLAPAMGRGRFSVEANSPDMFPLAPRVQAISTEDKAPMQLTTSGDWNNNLLTLDTFDLALGEGTLVAGGSVGGLPDFNGTDLRFDWNISSIHKFSVVAGRELPDDSAHLKFHLTGSRGVVQLEEFDGKFGDSDITGHFAMRSGDVPEIEIGFTSERLNLAPYLPEPESPEEKEEPPAQRKERLIPDTPIPVDALKKVTATVNIDVKEIDLGQKSLLDVVLIGALADGALVVDQFNLRNNVGGSMSGGFELRPSGDGAALALDIEGSGLTLGLPSESEEAFAALPRYALDTVLIGNGATMRELAGSLNGYLRLIGGEGRMKASALRFFTSDFLFEVLNTINPFVQSNPYTNFECSAILVQVIDGNVTGRPMIVTQSDRLRIFANANIDLKSEKLDVDIRTVPQKGLGLSFSDLVNPYTKLGGTLASPSLTLDPEGALIEGGAAVATGGLSILALRFKERFLDTNDPCGKAVEDTNETFQQLRAKYHPDAAASGP